MILDSTTIHQASQRMAHLIGRLLWRGAPLNHDATRPIQILVNHGYVVGFCPDRLQPAWSAYRVQQASDDVGFGRPLLYYDDPRLPEEHRIGPADLGRIGGIQLSVGALTPSEVINRQFGRLAQLETFFLSNTSPQYASLSSGVWRKLETAISEIDDEPGEACVWVTVGPIFGGNPSSIGRAGGKRLPVPEAYFCIVVEAHDASCEAHASSELHHSSSELHRASSEPHRATNEDGPAQVHLDCFIIPQNAPRDTTPEDYPATLEDIERATNLEFFEGFRRDEERGSGSRLSKILRRTAQQVPEHFLDQVSREANSINDLESELKHRADAIRKTGELDADDLRRIYAIQHTTSYLVRARALLQPSRPPPPPNLITYKIVTDFGGKLKQAARTACNFWNRFVRPQETIVVRLCTFTQNNDTLAHAYQPYTLAQRSDASRSSPSVSYSRIEFNTKHLASFTDEEIAASIVHAIGHSLGMGQPEWDRLYDSGTRKFTFEAARRVPALAEMEVKRGAAPETVYSHWDETRFRTELMTAHKTPVERVLPVTIDVMELLGHEVTERLPVETPLTDLLREAAGAVFTLQSQVLEHVNLDHFVPTEVAEVIPYVANRER